MTPWHHGAASRKRSRQISFCAPHSVVSQHMSYPPSHFGYTHSLLFTCPGQAFFIRAVILRSFTTIVSLRFARAIDAHPASARHRLTMLLSPHCVICPMDFRVHQRKHHVRGTRHSYACRHRRFEPDFERRTRRVHHLARHGIYVGNGAQGWVCRRPAVLHARARPTTVREDIFPGHPQYFAGRRARSLDLDEA